MSMIGDLSSKEELLERIHFLEKACSKQNEEICQCLGKVLGYPWLFRDQKNFPGCTESDGVCVGDHVAETIAEEAAKRILDLRQDVMAWRDAFFDHSETLKKHVAELQRQNDALREDVSERMRAYSALADRTGNL